MLPSRIKPISHALPPNPPSNNAQPEPELKHKDEETQGDHDEEEEEEDDDDQAEDHLSSFLHHLFPDEAPPCLGEPGQSLLYSSDLFRDLTVMIPDYSSSTTATTTTTAVEEEDKTEVGEHPDADEGRKLFAHYLWGGALVIAEGIEAAARVEQQRQQERQQDISTDTDARKWSVKGHKVLEVGAGAALPSIISALAGAETVTITDHPSSAALYGAIQSNISKNIPQHERGSISIQPYEWGVFEDQTLDSSSSTSAPIIQKMAQFATTNKGQYTRILSADCLWMEDQHVNLIRTLLWFLAPPTGAGAGAGTATGSTIKEDPSPSHDTSSSGSASGGRAMIVAGFHTGRKIVASFFDVAVSMGLVIDQIWERDVNATYEEGEVTRPWASVREDEGPENRSRWCVVAILSKGK